MANGCHLIILWLDPALMDDEGRARVVGEVVFAFASPGKALPGCLGRLLLGVALSLSWLA